ncbi:unnamed protein product [Somion occarium]|uniref:GYF domain-containing protein n=1 Tax=Somion occarium TaxID=3059160 RepID=A0ABP1CM34_9APHY
MTTTMHFGPEWMRTKQAPSRPAPSPPLATTPASPGISSYSALVAPASQPPPEKNDLARPFRYSKEDLLRIYKEGGGRGGLGLEVERWEGIVREVGYDPVGLKEMNEAERKIFSGPLNSEARRRQSTDYLSPLNTSLGERPKLGHTNSATGSPLRERMGTYVGRRKDSTDQLPLPLPRKQSLSSMQGPLASPREASLPSPRVRVGPAFDGVLNESWTSKRRVPEGLAKSGSRGDLKEAQREGVEQGIKEEEEEPPINSETESHPPEQQLNNSSTPVNDSGNGSAHTVNPTQPTTFLPTVPASNVPSGPPPGIVDLASVEWSYLDPQGQIQGPFRADVMQKWYDEGYFTPELLMKRMHVDTDWTSVRDLLRFSNGGKMFLSPIRRPEPFLNGLTAEQTNQYNSPFEPVPSRAIRTATLDSYLHNDSNASDSPTSSFSAGRFTNNSPDPSILSGRIGGHLQQTSSGSPFNGLNAMEPLRRVLDESFEVSSHSYGGYSPARANPVDPLMFNGVERGMPYSPGFGVGDNGLVPNASVFNANRTTLDMPVVNSQSSTPMFGTNSPISMGGGFGGQQEQPRLMNLHKTRLETRPEVQSRLGGFASENGSPFLQHSQAFIPGVNAPYQHDAQSLQSLGSVPERRSSVSPNEQAGLQQPHVLPTQPTSPWAASQSPVRRPGPFEPNYPTAQNTILGRSMAPGQPLSTVQPAPPVPTQSPWQTVQPGVNEPWGQNPSSLTTANLGQHDQQQQKQVADQTSVQPTISPVMVEAPVAVPTGDAQASSSATVIAPSTAPEPPRTKKQRKEAALSLSSPAVKPTSVPAPAPVAPTKTPSPVPSAAESKPAWAVDEDRHSSGAVKSLREIQELEARQAEARKAAERERAARAAAAVATSPSAEDIQPFTASWGLPISQAGAARSNSLLKDSATSPPANGTLTTPPVWTNAPKTAVAKKTMKEIQEEEEKRKKMAAKEKETVAAAARRAYAETTTKTVPSSQSGGVWTTVGSSGKATAPPAVAATIARPMITPTASKGSIPTSPAISTPSRSAASPARPSPAVTVASKVVASSPRMEEAPPPSSDFLKWLSESLKGLNSSVNFEEITSMLLSFPLDPDPSTVELISDLIYANSTTLDGRRFASEFVARRRASTRTAAPPGTAGKPMSIADVVKTQPRSTQNEWGGFKVVNKKKKGARN